MKLYTFILFIIFIFTSCSRYTIDEDSTTDSPDNINVYINFQKNAAGEILDFEYPVWVYFVNKKNSSVTEFNYEEGEGIVASLPEGEYSINAFLDIDSENFVKANDISGRPMITVNGNGVSDSPLMAAHSSLILEKQTELSLTPAYIVASVNFEFENIPSDVKKVWVEIFPVSYDYLIEGEISDRIQTASVDCYANNGKWISGQKYIFPIEGAKTVVTVSLDYGGDVKKYSYTFVDGLKAGYPYKFTGGYDENLSMDGDFQISAWAMEEEIVIDFDNEKPVDDDNGSNDEQTGDDDDSDSGSSEAPDDIYYVDTMPSANKIWGPFFLWKLVETGLGEAQATIISPDQWYQIYKDGEAMEILKGYEIDGISGWRTFTKDEAQEFFKEFSTELDELNPYLEENGHNIFYTPNGNTRNRYLCENGEYAFNMFGSIEMGPAGKTVKYYLRPVKIIGLKVKN